MAEELAQQWKDVLNIRVTPVPVTEKELRTALQDGSYTLAGVDVKAVGKVGADDNGDFVVNTLSEHGLDVSGIAHAEGVPTSFTDVMTVASTGERTFFNIHGAR